MPVPAAAPPRAPLLRAPLLGWFAVSFCALLSFYLPLSVVPSTLLAGGAGPVAAGWVMGVLVLHAVAAELAAPWLAHRLGPMVVAAAGLALMALSGAGTTADFSVPVVLALTAVRGFGFGLVVVVVAARIAGLVPAERRGEGLGWAGVVAGLPAVAGLPVGIWLAGQHGSAAAGAAAALAAAIGLFAIPWARQGPPPDNGTDGVHPAGTRVLAVARRAHQRRPATVFLAVVASAGVLIAFLPSVAPASPGLTGLAILVHSGCATSTRLLAGIHGDRHGHRGWLRFGVLGTGIGLVVLALLGPSPALLVAAMVLSGAAFGAAQSASLTVMFQGARPDELPAVSALWNAAYDLGLGLGPVLFGVALVHGTASTALLVLACVVGACLPLARRPT